MYSLWMKLWLSSAFGEQLPKDITLTLWSDAQPGVWLTGRVACRSYQEAMSILGELCDALQVRYEGYRREQEAIRSKYEKD